MNSTERREMTTERQGMGGEQMKFELYQGIAAGGRPFAMILSGIAGEKLDGVVCQMDRDRDIPKPYDQFVEKYAPVMVSALNAAFGGIGSAELIRVADESQPEGKADICGAVLAGIAYATQRTGEGR